MVKPKCADGLLGWVREECRFWGGMYDSVARERHDNLKKVEQMLSRLIPRVRFERKARGKYRCIECGTAINVGKTYEVTALATDRMDAQLLSVYAGNETIKTCLDCRSIRDEFGGDEWLPGTVLSHMKDYVTMMDGEIPDELLNRLTLLAEYRVLTMVAHHRGGGLWRLVR